MGQTSDNKRQPSGQAKELAVWRKKAKFGVKAQSLLYMLTESSN